MICSCSPPSATSGHACQAGRHHLRRAVPVNAHLITQLAQRGDLGDDLLSLVRCHVWSDVSEDLDRTTQPPDRTLDITDHQTLHRLALARLSPLDGHLGHDVPVCLLYTSDAADDLTRVDLGGRRIIKKKKK